jgi:hypothetical protein
MRPKFHYWAAVCLAVILGVTLAVGSPTVAKACGGGDSADHHRNTSSGQTGSSHMGSAMGSGHMSSPSQWGQGKVYPGQVRPPVPSSPGTPVPGPTYPSGAAGAEHSGHSGHTSTR